MIEKLITKKVLRRSILDLLEKDQETCVCAVIFRVKGTNHVKVHNFNGRLAEEKTLKIIENFSTGQFVLIDLMIDKETPVVAQACPVYGCLDCEAPECDEECPPGTCQ